MSDITRDDLDLWIWTDDGHARPITDEDVPAILEALDAVPKGSLGAIDWLELLGLLSELDGEERAQALRALLTTECETCGGWGDIDFPTSPYGHRPLDDSDDTTCPDCDGGRVLAEGVRPASLYGEDRLGAFWESESDPDRVAAYIIPAHMIEGR